MGTEADDDPTRLDNPAGRLHNLLSQLAKTSNPDKTRIGPRLGELLNVSADDRAELLRRIAPIYGLPAQIREDVDRLPFDGTHIIDRLGAIEHALLQMHIGTAVAQWAKQLPEDAMHGLAICSSILSQHVADTHVRKDQLEEVRCLVDEVMTSLRASKDLPADLHAFLLDHLQQMQYALDLYPVVGSKALEQAFERTIGALVLHPELPTDETRAQPVWGRFGKLLAGIGLLFATLNQGTELVESYFPGALPAAVDRSAPDANPSAPVEPTEDSSPSPAD